MIYSRLSLNVPYSDVGVYADLYSFRLPRGIYATKLTVMSRLADSVVQVREDDGGFPLNPEVTEQKLDRGFTSLVFETPITGFRFRAYQFGAIANLSFTAYG